MWFHVPYHITRQDMVSTGKAGYEFIKLDAGMTDVLRPSLYGALHPIVVVPAKVREGVTTARLKYQAELLRWGCGIFQRLSFR